MKKLITLFTIVLMLAACQHMVASGTSGVDTSDELGSCERECATEDSDCVEIDTTNKLGSCERECQTVYSECVDKAVGAAECIYCGNAYSGCIGACPKKE